MRYPLPRRVLKALPLVLCTTLRGEVTLHFPGGILGCHIVITVDQAYRQLKS